MEMDAEAFHAVLQKVLYEFPISSVQLLMPGWIKCLDDQDPWKTELFAAVQQDCHSLSTIDSVQQFTAALAKVSRVESVQVRRLDLSTGDVQLDVQVDHSYFYQVLSEKCGLTIATNAS